ncbi:phage major capsid protein [Novosphingobium lindaniclasticum]|uniref:Capsid protein n=1 Tax=Novosphingobium lindaniclasticum LE124 TaxID=1096930 RepID=T0H047_9SPHN|nr:phage major capsid protein [Novosphingobium lindaniclasticum]EQB09651.1 capsid protein [Novosphingobium lindaniclasticum LE124]
MKPNHLILGASSPCALLTAAAAPRALLGATIRADGNDPKALFEQLNKAVVEMRAKHEESLKSKVDDAVLQEHVERINTSIGNIEEAMDAALAKIAAAKIGGKEDPRDPEYTEQFNSYFRRGVSSDRLETVKAAATKTDGEGGYLAPVEWDRTLASRLKQVSSIRQYATVISISGAGFSKVFSDRNVGSGWVGETAARPATTTPGLTSLGWGLGELYANPAASQGLIDDAEFDVEAWLADEVETEFARQEGIANLSGDGNNKPHGILTYVTGGANAARHPWGDIKAVNSGAAAALTGDGLMTLIYELPEEYEANARLFLNRTTAGSARKLKDGQGNYLWQPAFEAGQPATIGGQPVAHLPGMPSVAAGNIAALYGDMRETYLVIDRIGIRVLRDPYTNKPFVHFYTTKRVGGGVKNPDAMKALIIGA